MRNKLKNQSTTNNRQQKDLFLNENNFIEKKSQRRREKDKILAINRKERKFWFQSRIRTLAYRSESESGPVALAVCRVNPIPAEARERRGEINCRV